MTNDDALRKRVQEIGESALELDEGAERDEFIERVCEGDRELKATVMRYVSGADDPMFDPLPPPPATAVRTGQQIGRWTLEQKIGEGGLGVVYRASRSDREVRQRGAIKFLRGTFHSRDLEIRFRDERQILANLSHPYIVGLIDGGVTGDGQPYLVMHLVENGEPLDVYCRKRQLPLQESLALFQKICEAVSYAHRKMVVHRDLKPGNILVTPDGIPHLLDFGVAKILDPMHRAGVEEAHSSHVLLGTERYFSPEQARMEPLDQSTDVYSLGLILYEILTGTDPYDFEHRVRQSVQEIVCKVDPELPSRAVERRSGTDAAPERTRRVELAGDIDAILIQALRKERGRRYPSAEEFSADIQRHLDHVPVKARLNTVAYRVSRFVRRNRTRVMAATALGTLALVLLVLAFVQLRRSSRESSADKARALAGKSSEALDSDPLQALTLAVAAVESSFNQQHYTFPVAENALHRALGQSRRRWQLPGAVFTGPLVGGFKHYGSFDVSPDGMRLASADGSSIVAWDVEAKHQIREIRAHDSVTAVVFSPDGARLAAGFVNGEATVWDVKTGQEIRSLRPPAGAKTDTMQVSHQRPGAVGNSNPGPVTQAAFSPDGSLLAKYADDAIEVWDIESGRRLLGLDAMLWTNRAVREQRLFVPERTDAPRVPFPGPPMTEPQVTFVWDSAQSTPGRRILVASIEGRGTEKWNVDSGVRTFQMLPNTGGMSVRNEAAGEQGIQIFWSRDSRMFSTIEGTIVTLWVSDSGSAGGARTWLADDGTRFRELGVWTSSSPVQRVEFGGRDGKRLTIFSKDRSVKIFDLQTNTELLSLRADRAELDAEGTRLASANDGRPIEVWETSPESEVAYLPSPIEAGGRMVLSRDGSRIATILPSSGPVAIWDANTGRRLITLGPEDERSIAVAFNRDGTRVVSLDMDGIATIRDAVTGEEISSLQLLVDTYSSRAAFNEDGTRVLVINSAGHQDLWNPETGERLANYGFESQPPGGEQHPSPIAFTRDGARIATASNGVVWIRNSADGTQNLNVPAGAPVTSLAFNANGKRLAIGLSTGKVSVADASSGQLLYSVAIEPAAAVDSLAFSPLGDRLAAGGADGEVKILEAASGAELLHWLPAPRFLRQPSEASPPPDSVRSLIFVPNGKHLIVGSDSGVRVVTLDTGELLRLAHARMAEATR